MSHMVEHVHAAALVLHEELHLKLYRRFARRARNADLKRILSEMIGEEERHVAVWQRHARGYRMRRVPLVLKLKYATLATCATVFGDMAIRIIIEAIEVHGIREYLILAHRVRGTALEAPLDDILRDELKHEGAIVGGTYVEAITGERIRSFLFGFNDGLVEMLGVVVGFYATLSSVPTIMLAGLSVISAGAFSMGAGAYSAARAEHELDSIREAKEEFLATGKATVSLDTNGNSFISALIVGCSYIVGGIMPLAPVFFGAIHVAYAVASSIVAIIAVSIVLAFVSGISVTRRVALNLILVTAAVLFAMGVGTLVSWTAT